MLLICSQNSFLLQSREWNTILWFLSHLTVVPWQGNRECYQLQFQIFSYDDFSLCNKMSSLWVYLFDWLGLQKHDFIEHFLRQYFQKCHYSTRELALSVPRCHPNNTVSEELKLGEIASRVMKDRFASSVNNSDLWNDDPTNRASLLLLIKILCSAWWSCQDPDGNWEWWWKAPVLFLVLVICECSSLQCRRL